jgi:uncharacterized protein YndB with AHSA1/START domain
MQVVTLAPVEKRVSVALSQREAFDLFTAEMATWWPLQTHSIAGDKAASCVFEGRVGGRLYEVAEDGTEGLWATVAEWDPPGRFVLNWHPGRGSETAQSVEVVFGVEGESTSVELTHTGWEAAGERAAELRASYEPGWDETLGRFVTAAER